MTPRTHSHPLKQLFHHNVIIPGEFWSFWFFFRGSAIAKILGKNVQGSDIFEEKILMYMYEENVNGRKLTEIVNTEHENVKYLPGVKIPENVVSLNRLLIYSHKILYSLQENRMFTVWFLIANKNGID